MNRVAKLIRKERRAQGLTLQALAEQLGWKNLNKGARRIESLENGERVAQDLFDSLVEVLDLDPDEINELALVDHDERVTAWARHMAELRSLKLYWHPMRSIAIRQELNSPELDIDDAIEQAVSLSQERNTRVSLRVNGCFTYVFYPDGRYTSFGGPYTSDESVYLQAAYRSADN